MEEEGEEEVGGEGKGEEDEGWGGRIETREGIEEGGRGGEGWRRKRREGER